MFFIALVVKGWNIGETNIGGDECFSVYNAQLSISEIISWLSKGNNPPLWEILLHYWINFFGISEVAVRWLSLLFNAGTVIPLVLIGERFFGRNTGLYAALLFIFSSFSLFLAHEARVYSLVGFLVTWSVYFYLNLFKNNHSIKTLGLLTITNGLILYSHYLAVWVIIIQVLLFLLIKPIRKQLGLKYLYHIIGLFILFLPFLPVIIERILDSGVKGTWVQKSSGIEALYFMLVDFFNAPVVAVIAISLFLFSGAKSIIKRRFDQKIIILNAMIWIPLIVSFLLSFKVGFFLNRYFYFVLPLLYLSLVSIVFNINVKNRIISIAIVLIPLFALLFSFEISTAEMIHSGNHKEIKPLVEKIKKLKEEKSSIIYLSPVWFDKELVYYLDKKLFTQYFQEYKTEIVFQEPLNKMGIFPIYSARELKLNTAYEEIVFIDNSSDFHLPNNGILKELKSKYKLLNKENLEGIVVYSFQN